METYQRLNAQYRPTDKSNILMIQIVGGLLCLIGGISLIVDIIYLNWLNMPLSGILLASGVIGLYATLRREQVVKWAKYYCYILIAAFVLHLAYFFLGLIFASESDFAELCREDFPEEDPDKCTSKQRGGVISAFLFYMLFTCCYCTCYLYCSKTYVDDLKHQEQSSTRHTDFPNDEDFVMPIPLDTPQPRSPQYPPQQHFSPQYPTQHHQQGQFSIQEAQGQFSPVHQGQTQPGPYREE